MQNVMNSQKKSFFREMDMFGERVIFTFNGKSTMKSGTGFVSSVVLLLIAVCMFFFMGQSFILKVDPQSVTSILNLDKIPFFNTTNDNKMFIALKLRTNTINFKLDGRLFDVYSTRYFRSKPRQDLYFTECSKLKSIDRNYARRYNLDEFYCLPLSFEDFGGSAALNGSNTVNLVVIPCSVRPNVTNTCNPFLSDIVSGGQTSIFFDIYYPEVFYDPNNFSNPIKIEHSLSTDEYRSNATVNRELYFKTTRMNNDVGWIFRDNIETNYTSIGKAVVTKSFRTYSKDIIYNLNIFPSVTFEEYTRKYQKIQDVVAVVGGFIQISQIALGMVIFYYVKYLKSEYLINGLINWQNSTSEDGSRKKVNNLIEEINSMENKQTVIEKKFNTHLGMTDKVDIQSLKMKDDKSQMKNLDQSGEIKNDNTEYFLGKFVLKPKLEGNKVENKRVIKSKTSGKQIEIPVTTGTPFRYKLSLGEIFKKNMCRSFLNSKQSLRVEAFELADNYVRELLDVFGYLNLVLEVKNLKNILFNPSQKACFNFVERPTFNIPEDMDEKSIIGFRNIIYNTSNNTELDKKKIAEYFAYNIYSNNITMIDQKLLAGLNEDVLKVISTRLSEMRDNMKADKMFKFNEEFLE
jgi:hypothetical protein